MSAPAMNALLPVPVRITPSTEASAFASANAVCKSAQVDVFSALSTLGRLTVTEAIDPFFSYRTLPSANAALGKALGAAVGEGMTSAVPETMIISPGWVAAGIRVSAGRGMSHESAVTGDGFANDQILHLIGTFIGIERLGIGEEARDIVVSDDAIAAQDFASP